MAAETDRDEDTVPDLDDEYDSLWVLSGVPRGYSKETASGLFQVSPDQYLANRKADVRGTANPSIMDNPFWIYQVGPNGFEAWGARTIFESVENPCVDFNIPVWCFDRVGATYTKIPDGRLICIGGEHADVDNRDFCIYNDVVVYDAPQETDPPPLLTPDCITIYGYPVHVFPPTDFHTSTYYADSTTGKEMIFIIGGVGYAHDRTNVYKLDLSDFSIQTVETSGPGPIGPTDLHKASLLIENEQPVIRITTEARFEEFTKIAAGDESSANVKKGTTRMINEKYKLLVKGSNGHNSTTKEGSEVFTLRISDMRWI